MNEDLHDINEPAISANMGWQQMHYLLNEHLPVKRQIINRKLLLHCAYSAFVLSILFFPALRLDNNILHTSAGGNAAHSISGLRTANSLLMLDKTKRILTINKLPRKITLLKKPNIHLSFEAQQVLRIDPNNTSNKVVRAGNITKSSKGSMVNGIIERITVGKYHATAIIIPGKSTLAYPGKSRDKVLVKGSWSLFSGIGVNASVNNSQNFQPYPVAEARYDITPHFYLAAGLSAWSPISTSTGGLSKTVYLNDTINNISLYNEITTYSHLRYADMPISLGINVTKNLSVQSGIQLSALLNKRTKKVLSPYDFQMNTITPPYTAPISALATNMQQEYDLKVRNIDYRFVAGIRYAQKKISVGLMYQHGLRSIGSGNHTNKNSNHLFALNVLFQIK